MTAEDGAPRRFLIVNPNSNPAVTAQISATAIRVLAPDCHADVVEAPDSPFAIESSWDRIIAEPSVVALLRDSPGYDAYVMACFDDIAVAQARLFLDVPIIDAVTASVALAGQGGRRFAIVTTVATMVPGIETLLATLGVDDACTVLAADIRVAEAAAGDPDAMLRLDDTILRARNDHGATAVVLGSGGLTGHAQRLSHVHGLRVIDCIEAAIAAAEDQSRGDASSDKNRDRSSAGTSRG